MAVRDRLQHDANTRKKIQASQLINRLTDHALADDEVMTASQVNAAKVLLGKVIPDLKASDITIGAVEITHEQWLDSISGGNSGPDTDTDPETASE